MEQITCTTCGRADHNPFRVYGTDNKIVLGCVDACHTGQLVAPSTSSWWHGRPEAKRIRAAAKRQLGAR